MARKNSESANPKSQTTTRRNSAAKATPKAEPNLPTVSKQTAGGIVGATIGGMIAGPVGAVAGGVAGALVGNASAAGQHPIETAVSNVAAVTRKPIAIAVKRVKSAVASTMEGKPSPAGRRTNTAARKSTASKSTAPDKAKSSKARGSKPTAAKAKSR